ncbi:hypothetical protein [Pseudomonas sichuanensis]|uniref:hypothetical protein n=1 Tax=Pseudomonas sichuanensis TaxID=2213015 RepID=UPI000DA69F80|nr:hypothetical protein [Pseudomonas sichuanensis]
MNFWMSSEQHALVGDAEFIARNKIEPVIERLLEQVNLDCEVDRWSFISILMPDDRVGDYPEVRRYHKSKKVIEVRVQLPLNDFNEADVPGQVSMMLDALSRSVDMMEGLKSLKITHGDTCVLKEAVEKARAELLS